MSKASNHWRLSALLLPGQNTLLHSKTIAAQRPSRSCVATQLVLLLLVLVSEMSLRRVDNVLRVWVLVLLHVGRRELHRVRPKRRVRTLKVLRCLIEIRVRDALRRPDLIEGLVLLAGKRSYLRACILTER